MCDRTLASRALVRLPVARAPSSPAALGLARLPDAVMCVMLTYTRVSEHAAFGVTSRAMRRVTLAPESSPVEIVFRTENVPGWSDNTSFPPALLRLRPERFVLGPQAHTRQRFALICKTPTFQTHLRVFTFGYLSHGCHRHLASLQSLTAVEMTGVRLATLLEIGENCPRLQRIVISWLFEEDASTWLFGFVQSDLCDRFRDLHTLVCRGSPRDIEQVLTFSRSLTSLAAATPRDDIKGANALMHATRPESDPPGIAIAERRLHNSRTAGEACMPRNTSTHGVGGFQHRRNAWCMPDSPHAGACRISGTSPAT